MSALPWNESVGTSTGWVSLSEMFGMASGPLAGKARIDRATPSKENTSGQSNVISIPSAGAATIHRTLSQLRRYRAMSRGWDGNHADAPLSQSFDYAEQFLALLSTWKVPMRVEAQIFASGTAVLDVKSHKLEGQFEFLPNGTIAALVDVGGKEWDADVEGFDGKRIPQSIAEQLSLA
jgi:hypothetical protein